VIKEQVIGSRNDQYIRVPAETVRGMISDRVFRMPMTSIKISEKLSVTEINLLMDEDNMFPISGFPRSIFGDEIKDSSKYLTTSEKASLTRIYSFPTFGLFESKSMGRAHTSAQKSAPRMETSSQRQRSTPREAGCGICCPNAKSTYRLCTGIQNPRTTTTETATNCRRRWTTCRAQDLKQFPPCIPGSLTSCEVKSTAIIRRMAIISRPRL
jgi:hypothetical protein